MRSLVLVALFVLSFSEAAFFPWLRQTEVPSKHHISTSSLVQGDVQTERSQTEKIKDGPVTPIFINSTTEGGKALARDGPVTPVFFNGTTAAPKSRDGPVTSIFFNGTTEGDKSVARDGPITPIFFNGTTEDPKREPVTVFKKETVGARQTGKHEPTTGASPQETTEGAKKKTVTARK